MTFERGGAGHGPPTHRRRRHRPRRRRQTTTTTQRQKKRTRRTKRDIGLQQVQGFIRPRGERFSRQTNRYPLPPQLERARRQQSVLKHSPNIAYRSFSVVRK